jgi:peptidoglycan/xylan/chitin deacetylase (PgdA/CDA1 family)
MRVSGTGLAEGAILTGTLECGRRLVDAVRGCAFRLRHGSKSPGTIRVFRYHGVVERITDPLLEWRFTPLAAFRAQLRLFRMAPVLSLEELEAVLSGKSRAPRGAAAITFDDGYENSLAALDLLDRLRKPAALFVAAGPVSRRVPVWTAEVGLLLLHGTPVRIEAIGNSFPLSTRVERERALARISGALQQMPAAERRQAMDGLREQFPRGELQRLLDAYPMLRMLSWKDLRSACARGFAIGSRGVEGEALHLGQDPAAMRAELWLSKLRIERETGHSCRYFAFPSGTCHPAPQKEIERAGYALAFSSQAAAVTSGSDPYTLPRLPGSEAVRSLVSGYIWPASEKQGACVRALEPGEFRAWAGSA